MMREPALHGVSAVAAMPGSKSRISRIEPRTAWRCAPGRQAGDAAALSRPPAFMHQLSRVSHQRACPRAPAPAAQVPRLRCLGLPDAGYDEGVRLGWELPPPSSVKSDAALDRERKAKVAELARSGLLWSGRLREAMRTVRREEFVPPAWRDYAYAEIPLPLPGCPGLKAGEPA